MSEQLFKKMEIPLGNVVQNIRAIADGLESGEFKVVGMVAQDSALVDLAYRDHLWKVVIQVDNKRFEVSCSHHKERLLGGMEAALKNLATGEETCKG